METTSKRPTWFYDDVVDDYAWILRRLRRPETDVSKRRKEFALLAQQTPYPDLLFRLYDGKDIPVRGRGDVWAPFEPAVLVGGERLVAHSRRYCTGRHCCVHNPSDHSMAGFPQHFRMDRALMERICPHGIGHPDPDDLAYKRMAAGTDEITDAVHGCDGCCQ
jgi:hypothetical protein